MLYKKNILFFFCIFLFVYTIQIPNKLFGVNNIAADTLGISVAQAGAASHAQGTTMALIYNPATLSFLENNMLSLSLLPIFQYRNIMNQKDTAIYLFGGSLSFSHQINDSISFGISWNTPILERSRLEQTIDKQNVKVNFQWFRHEWTLGLSWKINSFSIAASLPFCLDQFAPALHNPETKILFGIGVRFGGIYNWKNRLKIGVYVSSPIIVPTYETIWTPPMDGSKLSFHDIMEKIKQTPEYQDRVAIAKQKILTHMKQYTNIANIIDEYIEQKTIKSFLMQMMEQKIQSVSYDFYNRYKQKLWILRPDSIKAQQQLAQPPQLGFGITYSLSDNLVLAFLDYSLQFLFPEKVHPDIISPVPKDYLIHVISLGGDFGFEHSFPLRIKMGYSFSSSFTDAPIPNHVLSFGSSMRWNKTIATNLGFLFSLKESSIVSKTNPDMKLKHYNWLKKHVPSYVDSSGDYKKSLDQHLERGQASVIQLPITYWFWSFSLGVSLYF